MKVERDVVSTNTASDLSSTDLLQVNSKQNEQVGKGIVKCLAVKE